MVLQEYNKVFAVNKQLHLLIYFCNRSLTYIKLIAEYYEAPLYELYLREVCKHLGRQKGRVYWLLSQTG